MKILLIGRTGQVGWELERVLPTLGEVHPMDRHALDLTNHSAVRRVLRDLSPTVIVNAAAYTAVDTAESERDLAFQINGVAPGILAEEAKRLGALLVHYSTDYIFDGLKGSPYSEADIPNPVNAYGQTKVDGEQRIAATGARYLIIRTSWVYGPRGKNFFLTIIRKALAREALRIVSDQHGVPSESGFIADATCALIKKSAEGFFNVVPSGETTWHGFAAAIFQRLGIKGKITAISWREYPTAAKRPAYSVLDCSKFSAAVGAPASWDVLLDQCIARWRGGARVVI